MYRKLILGVMIIFALSGCGQDGVKREAEFKGKIYFESNRFPGKSYLENTGTSYYTGKKIIDFKKDWWDPQINKRGDKLAYKPFVRGSNDIGEVNIFDVSSERLEQYDVPYIVLRVKWVPNSDKLSFIGGEMTKGGEKTWNIYVYDTSNKTFMKITDNKTPKIFIGGFSFSPDGKKMIYGIPKTNAPGRLVKIIDIDTGATKVLPFNSGNMDWSPDGKTIIFAGTYYEDDGKMNLGNRFMFYDVESGDYRIMEKPGGKDAFQYIEEPCYSPDGLKIAFIRVENSGAKSLWMMDADGSNWKMLLSGIGHIDSISWCE